MAPPNNAAGGFPRPSNSQCSDCVIIGDQAEPWFIDPQRFARQAGIEPLPQHPQAMLGTGWLVKGLLGLVSCIHRGARPCRNLKEQTDPGIAGQRTGILRGSVFWEKAFPRSLRRAAIPRYHAPAHPKVRLGRAVPGGWASRHTRPPSAALPKDRVAAA